VFGVTGNQGQWVAKSFSTRGFQVIGITRDVNSDKAKRVSYELRVADMRDPDQVAKAVEDCDVVFGVTQPWLANGGVDEHFEAKQCIGLVNGCSKAKTKHLVFAGVRSSERFEPDEHCKSMPHLRQKFIVNKLCGELNVPLTVLGPVSFVDNWNSIFTIEEGLIHGMADKNAKIPYVTCRDIGEMAYVAYTMGPPAVNSGRYLPVWTDFVSGGEICKIISKLRNGQHFDYTCPSNILLRLFAPEFHMMKLAFEKYGTPPLSQDNEKLQQMYETRNLLRNEYWTVEKWFTENHFATIKLKPRSSSTWMYVGIAVGIVVVAVAGVWVVTKHRNK